MVTDGELIFWCVCGVLTILAFCAIPFISNYLAYQDTKRMFENR